MRNLLAITLVALFGLTVSQALLLAQNPDDEQKQLAELRIKLRSRKTGEALDAVNSLRRKQTDGALDVLIEGLRFNLDDDVTFALIDAIASFKDEKALEGLRKGYGSCNSDCRKRIIGTVGRFHIPDADELILLGLNDSVLENQLEAVQMSAKKRTKKVILAMMTKMKPRFDRRLRKEIVKSVRPVNPLDEDIKLLKTGLEDNTHSVVKAALEKLAILKGLSEKEKVALVWHLARRDDYRTRITLAETLGKMVCDDSFRLLIDMLGQAKTDTEIETIGTQLMKYRGTEVVGLVWPLIDHKDHRIRAEAARVLAAQEVEDAKPYLVGALKDEKIYIRVIALQGLKKYRDTGLIETLMKLGSDCEDLDVRKKIVEVLLEMPPGSVKGCVVKCLDWVKGRPLYLLIELLGGAGDRNSAAAILGVLRRSIKDEKFTDAFLVISAAKAFRLMGGSNAESGLLFICSGNIEEAKTISIRGLVESQSARALRAVAGFLRDDSPAVRREAVRMLGMVAGGKFAEEIVKTLDDGDKKVRLAAITALGYSGDAKQVSRLTATKRLEKVKRSKEEFITVIEAVGRIGGPAAVEFLLKTAANGDKKIALAALEGLCSEGIRGNKEAATQLIKIAESGADVWVRSAAIRALGYAGGADVFDKLLVFARERKQRPASAAAEAITVSGDPRAAKELLALLKGSHRGSREGVVKALVRTGDEEAVEPLIKFIRGARRPYRAVYLHAIAHIQNPKVRSLLVEELSSPSREVVFEAVRGLVRWHDDEESRKAVPALLQKVEARPAEDIARACAAARRKEYVDALIGLLNRLDIRRGRKTQQAIFYALRCITNNNPGDDAATWSKWWQKAREKSLDEIVLDGFARHNYIVGPKDNSKSLFHCALALFSRHHHIRLNAMRRLASAAGEECDYVDEKEWKEQIAEKWYRWFISNKPKLSEAEK